MSKQELINSLQLIVDQLKGTMEHTITVNSSGRQSKKIVIEYDVTHKNDDG